MIKDKLNSLAAINTALNKRCEELQGENQILHKKLADIVTRVEVLERQFSESELVIFSLPKVNDEDLPSVVDGRDCLWMPAGEGRYYFN